jgi:hypothetical protein
VVHHLHKTLNLPGNTGVAVIYLNHKEIEIPSPSSLLASLWRQLVFGRAISTQVQQLYQTHREPRTRPALTDFHQVLCSTIAEYSKVFLIVDALDEYPDRKRNILLKNLANLGTNVNLMLTSRHDISVSFENTQSLEIRATAEDIRRYVNAQIDNSERLMKHINARQELRQEIETLCVERSDGMWVVRSSQKLNVAHILQVPACKASYYFSHNQIYG